VDWRILLLDLLQVVSRLEFSIRPLISCAIEFFGSSQRRDSQLKSFLILFSFFCCAQL
jgi:hypothetical protein